MVFAPRSAKGVAGKRIDVVFAFYLSCSSLALTESNCVFEQMLLRGFRALRLLVILEILRWFAENL